MVTMLSGHKTSNQQEFSVKISYHAFLTSIKGQSQEIMTAPADGFQDPYLAIIDVSTSENVKLYNKAIVGIP